MSAKIGAISVCSSFRKREVRQSGPAALPGFNLESCFATPLTDMIMAGIVGKGRDMGRNSSMSWRSFKGISLVKTDLNRVLRTLGFSTVAVWVIPFDLREVISLLSEFCCFTNA